jgi:hypothetical protein
VFGSIGAAALLTILFFVLAAALVVLGAVLVLLGLPLGGRRVRRMPLVAGALVLGAVGTCTVALSRPPPRTTLALDFTQGHRAEQLAGLGGSRTGDLHVWEGDVALDLRLPGDRGYAGPASLVTCRVEGEEVRDLYVSLPLMPLAEAHERAAALIGAWGLERRNLDDWHRRGGVGRFGPGDVFSTGSRGQDPEVGLEIRPGGDRWSIKLSAFWRP